MDSGFIKNMVETKSQNIFSLNKRMNWLLKFFYERDHDNSLDRRLTESQNKISPLLLKRGVDRSLCLFQSVKRF